MALKPTEPVLLTGATGFIGRPLAVALADAGFRVTPLTRPDADLLKPDTLTAPCRGQHTVIHLAASAHINRADPATMRAVNVTGTQNLLQAGIDAGVKHFIYMSSILADPDLDRPRTPYGQSKYDAEQILLAAHRAGQIRVTILRPVNVYGPGMKGNLRTLVQLIRKGLLPPLPDTGQSLSLIGVHDLCAAVVQAATVELPDTDTPVYPLTDGTRYTIKDIEAAVYRALGKKVPRWVMPTPLLFAGALGLELAGRTLRMKNIPGLRSYRAVTRGVWVDDTASREQLRYNPRATFQSELPQLLAAENQARD